MKVLLLACLLMNMRIIRALTVAAFCHFHAKHALQSLHAYNHQHCDDEDFLASHQNSSLVHSSQHNQQLTSPLTLSHVQINRRQLYRGASSAFFINTLLQEDVAAADSRIPTSYPADIIPYSSVRRYKTLTLSNGLRVLLVSDRTAPRASACLTVSGAGQFDEPPDLPGLAHLMEHMILSFNSKSTFRTSRDFEEWLGDNEGASNAFTAYEHVCFHFSCPENVLAEALQRFSGLFLAQDVEQICRDEATLRREIRRVDVELDFDDINEQIFYLTKQFVNVEHPYSRFLRGSLETLETIPKAKGIDVGSRLISFFRQKYLPSEAVVVIVSNADTFLLERLCSPFNFILSRNKPSKKPPARYYPGTFLEGSRYKHAVLSRPSGDSDRERITMQWNLNLDYRSQRVTATQICFVLAQILGRKGPGSLYLYLLRRGWIPSTGIAGIPRVSLPLDVPGMQIIRLDLDLTLEGAIRRSAVVEAVYDSFEPLRLSRGEFSLPRELVQQYASVAKLHGYYLAPRAPDAIELAVDALRYGLGPNGVGTGRWIRFADSSNEIRALQREMSKTISRIMDPNKAVIIATASPAVVAASFLKNDDTALLSIPLGSSSSLQWRKEPVSGAAFLFDDMLKSSTRLENQVLKRIVSRDELLPPFVNPLVPAKIEPARALRQGNGWVNSNELVLRPNNREADIGLSLRRKSFSAQVIKSSKANNWSILDPYPGQYGLLLPRGPPEPTCRCAFVLELLSPRPARADVRQAAHAQLWLESFETISMKDLAELGAIGGLAFDLSFNPYGLRLCVLGIRRTLPSYTRRLVRKLVDHSLELLRGPEYFPSTLTASTIQSAQRARNLSPRRLRVITSNLRQSTAYEAAAEGVTFLRSCQGGVCFAQGDLSSDEVSELLQDLQSILEPALNPRTSRSSVSAIPSIDELLYRPNWKPRTLLSCSIPGVVLVSDACGRVKR
jgi:insulysin